MTSTTSTTSTTSRTRTGEAVLRPADVDAVNVWHTTSAYRLALPMVAPLARSYADADDVASVASVLLGVALQDGLTGGHAAASAVKRAAGRLYGQSADMLAHEITCGDSRTADVAGTFLPRATMPTPDDVTRWTAADTLATVTSTLDAATLLLLGVAFTPEHADPRGRYGVAGVALASTLAGQPVARGRASAAAVALLTEAVDAARANVPATLASTPAGDSTSKGGGTDAPRWADVLTGPASPVVSWSPVQGPTLDGSRLPFLAWAVLSTGSVLLHHDRHALGALLLPLLTMEGGEAGTVREGRDADLLASTSPVRSARPVAGVTAGLRVGHSVAGTGQAIRATVSRKRKRDGSIGGSMTRA